MSKDILDFLENAPVPEKPVDESKAFIRYYSPSPSGPDWTDDGLEAYCGNCDEDLMEGFESWSYCPHCGKELWSSDSEGHEEKGWF